MPANVYSRERSRSGVVWAVMQENDQIKEMVWKSVLTQLPLPATAKAVYTGFQSRLSLLPGVRHFCFSLRATRWVLRRVRGPQRSRHDVCWHVPTMDAVPSRGGKDHVDVRDEVGEQGAFFV
jgi:hypothetical protein